MAIAAIAAAATGVLLATGGSDRARRAGSAVVADPAAVLSPGEPPRGTIVGCARRSEADFPGALRDPRNLVVGPLVLVGAGEPTPASVVREFGGNKFPLLVKAGHTVTVRLPGKVRGLAGLAYGGLGKRPLPEGKTRLRDAADTMTFIACRPARPTRRYRDDGPSAGYADGEQVTFWSGFALTRTSRCLPLEIYVDDDPSPRQVAVALGHRCRSWAVMQATCDAGGAGMTDVAQKRGVVIGPLVLLGARRTAAHRPEAFNRHGVQDSGDAARANDGNAFGARASHRPCGPCPLARHAGPGPETWRQRSRFRRPVQCLCVHRRSWADRLGRRTRRRSPSLRHVGGHSPRSSRRESPRAARLRPPRTLSSVGRSRRPLRPLVGTWVLPPTRAPIPRRCRSWTRC
jgi:hypothetical protein